MILNRKISNFVKSLPFTYRVKTLEEKTISKIEKITLSDGRVIDLRIPAVMGILNITPDSFYAGGYFTNSKSQIDQVGIMLDEGASIIDIGAVSTKPGAKDITEGEELKRLLPAIKQIRKEFPDVVLSIDTYRSNVAQIVLIEGANIINDISGGQFDEVMFEVIAAHKVPYIIMHIQGSPRDMQLNPQYENVVDDIFGFFKQQIKKLTEAGVNENIILDPGFGFGKTVKHNFEILKKFEEFKKLGFPLLAGISRKSMINKILNTKPEDALNGTTVLNTLALLNGANILRVHDVKNAIETIKLVEYYKTIDS